MAANRLWPGVYVTIKDNSQYVSTAIPGAIGFMCLLSEKGPDNKPVMVTSVSDLIKHFGEPNIRRYSQAWYVARAYLETLNNLWVMRVLPKNAKYATLALKLSDPSTNITKYSVTPSEAGVFPEIISRAYNIAMMGRKGGVVIDFPFDIKKASVDCR